MNLRPLRIALWAAFLLALGLNSAWRGSDVGAVLRYAPPVLLVLAAIVTVAEWRSRRA